MDEPQTPPLPPLPIGDTLGLPTASADALRQILRRHRRRQTAIGGVALVAVLAAGSLGGWAVGRHDRGSLAGVRVAAGGQPTATNQGGAPTAASRGGGAVAAVAGGSPIGTMLAPRSTQLLVRDASDGTRVRLYQQDIGDPQIACSAGHACPQAPVPPCAPTSIVMAEVSDDQVAGQTGTPLWQSGASGALQQVTTQVVGAGQPQPILVAIARTSAPTAKVMLTTAYGSDAETPTATGWVALAVRLPADFAADASTGAPAGKLVAADGGGNAIASSDLASVSPFPPACQPPLCNALAPPTSPTGSSTPGSAPSTSVNASGPATASGCGCLGPMVKPTTGSAGNVGEACASTGGSVSSGSGTASSGTASSGTASSGTASSSTASSGTASSGPAPTTP
jgi:hypothetical protein